MTFRLTLHRLHYSDRAIGGLLYNVPAEDGTFTTLYTLELPWRDNHPTESCVQGGEYLCKKYPSEKFGERYILTGVPDRDGILIHPGNYPWNTEGCILLGTGPGSTREHGEIYPAVCQSAIACEKLQAAFGFRDFLLRIEDNGRSHYGT